MDIEFLAPLTEKIEGMAIGLIQALPSIGLAFAALILTWCASLFVQKLFGKIFSTSHMRRSLIDFFLLLIRISVWIFGILMALTIIFPSMTPAKMLAGLGIGGIAVGFAFKDVFENFMAGAMIMLRKPMRIGDYIECEGLNGRVETITIRDTHIRRTDDQLVLVPNSFLFSNPVYIRTDKDLRRFTVICGVSYDTDLDEAAEVISKAVKAQDVVHQDKPIQVFAREFNSSSVDFTIRWWSKSKPIDMHTSRDKVLRAIKRALDDANIEIPFPYRTLTFKENLGISTDEVQETK